MTARERNYIQALMNQHETWSREEETEARQSDDPEKKALHTREAMKHSSAALVLERVLEHLEQKDYTI